MQPHVLLIEDDPHVVELIKVCLEQENFQVTVAEDGEKGFNLAQSGQFGLIILDIMLPKKDGWQVCRELNNINQFNTPILILTAKGSEVDRVLGLELGGDDYMVKPFSPRELVARARAILRRMEKAQKNEELVLRFDNISIDPTRYEIVINDSVVNLTPKEFELLYYLASNQGTILKRDQLLEHVWGIDYVGNTRTVDEHIKKLRQKLKKWGDKNKGIRTVWGVGYKFEVKK